MGAYRMNYPMMPEANRSTSVPHFTWFNPVDFSAAGRNGLDPFQGSQHNPEKITAIPIRSVPFNEAADAEPNNPSKKPKRTKSNGDGPKEPKLKKSRTKGSGAPSAQRDRRNLNFDCNEPSVDASGNPSAFCSCTGLPRQCYRWGTGGWQSACCTTNISEYPLPMSTVRPSSRTPGRKMSHGAYVKLLQRLASEGICDLTRPIDLKHHWARHGTNKYVTLQ